MFFALAGQMDEFQDGKLVRSWCVVYHTSYRQPSDTKLSMLCGRR